MLASRAHAGTPTTRHLSAIRWRVSSARDDALNERMRYRRAGSSLNAGAVPGNEYNEAPQLKAVRTPSLEMVVDDARDAFGVQHTESTDRSSGEQVPHQLRQRTSDPSVD